MLRRPIVSLQILFIFFSFSPFLRAQNLNQLIDKVNEKNNRIMERVDERRREIDRKYTEHINKTWSRIGKTAPEKNPFDEQEPVTPVPYDPDMGIVERVYSDPQVLKVSDRPIGVERTAAQERQPAEDDIKDIKVEVPCNGVDVLIRFPKGGLVRMDGTSEEKVSEAWKRMSCAPYENMFRDLSRLREYLSLSDWSLYRFVESLSSELYGDSRSPESVVFSVYVLNRLGFLICLGRSDEGQLYKCVATDMGVLNFPGYCLDGTLYYLFDSHPPQDLMMVDLRMNGEVPMNMMMNTDEVFYSKYSDPKSYSSKNYPSVTVEVESDMVRMAFYNDYPSIYSDENPLTSFYYHAMMPMSKSVSDTVYPVLRKSVSGKSEYDAVNILLDFVQTAFQYEYDYVVWGKERYLYADEIWHYNLSDCEDRSILFSRLVRDILGLEVALVYWPGHLSCAVNFNYKVDGSCFVVSGKKYVSCDPTYIGAGAGAVMPDLKDKKAQLIIL